VLKLPAAEVGHEAATYFDAALHASADGGDMEMARTSAGIAMLFALIDIVDHFIELLKKEKNDSEISKSDFVKKVCKPTENKAQETMHTTLDMLHAASVKAFKTFSDKLEASEDEDEKKDWAALKPFVGSMMGLDFKNISDTFWRDFEYQAKQIYEGLFEVLKCGRKTDKIDKKALEAIFVVVLGEDKVPVKDRLKHVFDAFDHNGDGDFKMDEMTPFIHAIFDLMKGIGHASATCAATFFTNHALPAAIKVGFMMTGCHHDELELMKAWMIFPGAREKPFADIIKAKFGHDKAAVKKFQEKLEEEIEGSFPKLKDDKDFSETKGPKVMLMSHFLQELNKNCN